MDRDEGRRTKDESGYRPSSFVLRPPVARLAALTWVELFKTGKRWLTWVLLGIGLAALTASLWGRYVFALTVQAPSASGFSNRELLRELILPRAYEPILDSLWIHTFLFVVLAASVVGAEHSWGTLRQVLVKGTGRAGYLAAKLIALASFLLASMVLNLLIGLAFSLVFSALTGMPPGRSAFQPDLLGETAGSFLARYLSIWVYGALAFAATVLTRITIVGVAAALGYQLLEGFASLILFLLGSFPVGALYQFLVTVNITVLDRAIHGESPFPGPAGGITGSPNFRPPPVLDPPLAALLLALYIALLLAAAFLIFRRRDIPGAISS
jgi:ABC-type transport system involved in multi-copper enzyme maturation permease subunit